MFTIVHKIIRISLTLWDMQALRSYKWYLAQQFYFLLESKDLCSMVLDFIYSPSRLSHVWNTVFNLRMSRRSCLNQPAVRFATLINQHSNSWRNHINCSFILFLNHYNDSCLSKVSFRFCWSDQTSKLDMHSIAYHHSSD